MNLSLKSPTILTAIIAMATALSLAPASAQTPRPPVPSDHLLSEMSSDNGTVMKFEYDAQNRLVKVLRYVNKKLESTKIISYSGSSVTSNTKPADGGEEFVDGLLEYAREGNRITYGYGPVGIALTVDNGGYITTSEKEWSRDLDVPSTTKYKYQGGNLVSTTETKLADGRILMKDEITTITFKYDDKPTPFHNVKSQKWLMQEEYAYYGIYGPASNLISSKGGSSEVECKYEYDANGFPTKQTRATKEYGKTERVTTTFTYRTKGAAAGASSGTSGAFSATAAITKEEWAILMQDAEFKAADQRLGEAYKKATAAIQSADSKQALLKEQRSWAAKRERDAFAHAGKGTPEYKRFFIDRGDERIAVLLPPPATSSGVGGVYAFGGESESRPSGTVIVYPVSSGIALFFLDVSRGAPSYNSGQLFGEMALSGSTGVYKLVDAGSGFNCAFKFTFAKGALEITTENGRDECGFGGNVSADNTYKLTGKPIPKGYAVGDSEYLFEDEAKRIRGKK